MSCQTRINVGVLLYAFCGLVSQGVASAQLIRYEKTIVKMIMPDWKSCHNVWWIGFMALEVTFDMSYPRQYNCDIHIDTQNDIFHYLNITVAVRNLAERYRDGSCEDHIQLYTDQSLSRPLTRRLCGTTVHSFLTAQSNFALVVSSNGGLPGAEVTLLYESYGRYDRTAGDDARRRSGAGRPHIAGITIMIGLLASRCSLFT